MAGVSGQNYKNKIKQTNKETKEINYTTVYVWFNVENNYMWCT